MPAVRTATERECGRGPGGQPGAPWSWPRLPAPLALAGYRLAVIAAELALTGWLLGRTPLRTSESVLFSAFLGCAAACVEATRRWGALRPVLLAALAAVLLRHARPGDVLGRFGGEEFVAFLPSAGEDEARRIAERLREQVSAVSVVAGGVPVTVTISIGVAALGTHGGELSGLLATADAALYRAKEAGRNRVCLLPPGGRASDPQP